MFRNLEMHLLLMFLLHFRKGRINVLMLYFHRYIRLTPLLGVSILFSISLLKFFGNGPLWPSTLDSLSQKCERNWWTTLLYIQNYVNPKDIVSISALFRHSIVFNIVIFLLFTSVSHILGIYPSTCNSSLFHLS